MPFALHGEQRVARLWDPLAFGVDPARGVLGRLDCTDHSSRIPLSSIRLPASPYRNHVQDASEDDDKTDTA